MTAAELPPRLRQVGTRIHLYCPSGHGLASIDRRDWAGSLVESMAGRPARCRECAEAAPKPRDAALCARCDHPDHRARDCTSGTAGHCPDITDRDAAIAAIKAALRRRTGIAWSVTGGRGTAWGWITVTAPPARRINGGSYMTDVDRAILADALGLDTVHIQGESIPASGDYRIEYVDRAEGRPPRAIGRPYWD